MDCMQVSGYQVLQVTMCGYQGTVWRGGVVPTNPATLSDLSPCPGCASSLLKRLSSKYHLFSVLLLSSGCHLRTMLWRRSVHQVFCQHKAKPQATSASPLPGGGEGWGLLVPRSLALVLTAASYLESFAHLTIMIAALAKQILSSFKLCNTPRPS